MTTHDAQRQRDWLIQEAWAQCINEEAVINHLAERLAQTEAENERLARRYEGITAAARRAGIRELEEEADEARLRSAPQPLGGGLRDRMRDMLEWFGICPICGLRDQHESDCDWGNLLRDLRTPEAQGAYVRHMGYQNPGVEPTPPTPAPELKPEPVSRPVPPTPFELLDRIHQLEEEGSRDRIERLEAAVEQLARIEEEHLSREHDVFSNLSVKDWAYPLGAIAREVSVRNARELAQRDAAKEGK